MLLVNDSLSLIVFLSSIASGIVTMVLLPMQSRARARFLLTRRLHVADQLVPDADSAPPPPHANVT